MVLAVLGVSDFLVLNVVIWPRCVEEGARSERSGLASTHARQEEGPTPLNGRQGFVTAVESTKRLEIEAGAAVPQVDADYESADSAPTEEVERTSEEPDFSEVGPATSALSSRMASPEIEDFLFASRSTALSRRAEGCLDEVVAFMLADREVRLLIRGHADDRGNEPANQRLSERRASESARYLRMQGISLDRIDIEGVGERHPADRSGSPLARARNRRVEVVWQRRDTP